jgi:transcriptional regulator with GAF, ATPase, and Fis domain
MRCPNVAECLSKAVGSSQKKSRSTTPGHVESEETSVSSALSTGSLLLSNSVTTHSTPKNHREGPGFAYVIATASHITSFSCFDELVEKLSSALSKQARATRLLLLMRDTETGELEKTAEHTVDGPSLHDALLNAQYSNPIVKITDTMQEQFVVHSAQQESPHCFDSYIQESGVQSVAALPITYQNATIAVVYMEHSYGQEGVFTFEIMEIMALLAQHVASSIIRRRRMQDLLSPCNRSGSLAASGR